MFGPQPINFTLQSAVAIPRYHIVVATGTNYCNLATATTGVNVGVSQNETNANEFVTIAPFGRSRIYCGSAVSLGNRITANLSGRAIAAGSGDTYIGIALEAGVAGDYITCLLGTSIGDKVIA